MFALSRRGLNLLRFWPSHVVTRTSFHSSIGLAHLTLIFDRELLVINKAYNAAMLAEAVCKLAGFIYAPSDTIYWQHGYSTERDFTRLL